MSIWGYILHSEKDGSYYIGQSDDVRTRLRSHNTGRVISTKHGMPWTLVFLQKFASRRDAIRWERLTKGRKS